MSYRVIIPKPVLKQLDGLLNIIHDRIIEEAKQLGDNPRPPGCIKLTGRHAWRVKVGDYRIIYEIDDRKRVVVLVTVGHRKEVYR